MPDLYGELTRLFGTSVDLAAHSIQEQAQMLYLRYGSDRAAAEATGLPRSSIGFWRRGQRLPKEANRTKLAKASRTVEADHRPTRPPVIMTGAPWVIYGAEVMVSSDRSDRRSMTIQGSQLTHDVRSRVADGLRDAWINGPGAGFKERVIDAMEPAVRAYLPAMHLMDLPTGEGPRYGTATIGSALQFGGAEPLQAQPFRDRPWLR